jgi:hypothetical protein
MDEEDFDGETHPLPDDLKFKDLVNMSLELSEKMGEHLDGQEQTLAVCSLILLLKKGMKMVQLQCSEIITDHPSALQVLTQCCVAEEAITKFLALYPSLRIGDSYEQQVEEYFAEEERKEKQEKSVVEVPTEEELSSLCDSLFRTQDPEE